MLTGILGFILGSAGIAGHWFFTKLWPVPSSSIEILKEDMSALSTSCANEYIDTSAVNWKVFAIGDTLLTPMLNDYVAVVIHAVMEDNFYNVRLLSDTSKYLHIHASLLFLKDEIDLTSTSTKN